MQSLQETISFISDNYPQDSIDLDDFDLLSLTNIKKKQPKFLYRGEKTDWKETKSKVSRNNLINHSDFNEINHWVSGRNIRTGHVSNRYSLCFFLREALREISCITQDESIPGLLQHYNFDTSFIDLTSDIKVAGFFASYQANIGDIGQIMIIPTQSIENRFFDLTTGLGERPKQQKSYVIIAPLEFDLKSEGFLNNTKSVWKKFKLTEEDKEIYNNPNLLSTTNDQVVVNIIDWYECHIQDNESVSKNVGAYFKSKIEGLRKYCG
jgi:hypothetical protein